MSDTIPSKKIRQVFVLLIILLFAILIFLEMIPYLLGVFGAITMYVLLRKWMAFLVRKKWHPDLAAGMLMFLSFICILLPVSGIIFMLGNKIGQVVNNSEKVEEAIKNFAVTFENKYGYDLSSNINVSEISKWLASNLDNFAGSTFNTFIALGLMYFMLYYMLTNRNKLKDSLLEYIPIDDKNLKIIGKEAVAMVRSNAVGIPLVAIAQGLIALIGLLIFDIKDPFFWFIIVTIGSMIPFVGTLIGIIPVFVLTISSGNEFTAWGILIYGLLVVGSTDNIIRLFVLRKLDNVHPLITLIGVIVGVPLFGFIGLIFGPLLISLFLIIMRIYKKEFGV
ncbi:Predicted PurR-regulated permease PerM [Polaribacter sp. KT25b]|uniref:AI-2E family transporter n=1 Tax=Polaribacter sp. KT25b TaxID=1855336 RepID=UPI00087DC045|nr:AI-2E family transporter [Polaribacter sp. KT25b]SDR87822.1 Predicted PurR-regulated permease PerM [Polaribacter sp. KT25b]